MKMPRAQLFIGGKPVAFDLTGVEYSPSKVDVDAEAASLTMQGAIPGRIVSLAASFKNTVSLEGFPALRDMIDELHEARLLDDAAEAAVLDASVIAFRGERGNFLACEVAGVWKVLKTGVSSTMDFGTWTERYLADRASAILIAKGLSTGLMTEEEAKGMAYLAFPQNDSPASGEGSEAR
jgi:hypothetical protein